MDALNVLAGLASLAALSLFLAWFLRRSSSLMPLVAVACAMVFFTLAGCLGLLYVAGWVWYALCAAGFVAVLVSQKGRFWKLATPGFVFFVVAGVLVVALFAFTQPMLTQWDEFTFWGTAAKATSGAGELYTTAQSNLIARTYPPGLIVYTYVMQFFGGFSEAGFIACFAILYFACFAAAGALWGKNRTATILFMAALVLLPFFFEVGTTEGRMLWTYQVCMADLPMAALFGGALCFYHAGGEKSARRLLPFGIILAALTSVKDMGLALAAVALFVVLVDMIFVERRRLGFYKLRRWPAILAAFLWCAALMAGAYLLWAAHLDSLGSNRFEVGSYGIEMSLLDVVKTGVLMLFGVGRSEAFSTISGEMLRALWQRPVCMFGPGVVVLAVILVVSALAFVFSATKRQRLRVGLFTLAMAVGFVGFYIFNIFTYTFVFHEAEGLVLKDYARYMLPYWMAWLMGALCLLSRAATWEKASFYRLRVSRAVAMLVCVALVAGVFVRGNWQGNVLRVSPTQYSVRQDVRAVVQDALAEGMQPDDLVYIISQDDDGTRFYMFGFEMEATRELVYGGDKMELDGTIITDEAGVPVMSSSMASTLIPPGGEARSSTSFECTPDMLAEYLRMHDCTHLLLDVVDEYILADFAELFSDGLAGWDADDPTVRGNRYYRVQYGENGKVTLVPQGAAAGEGGGA